MAKPKNDPMPDEVEPVAEIRSTPDNEPVVIEPAPADEVVAVAEPAIEPGADPVAGESSAAGSSEPARPATMEGYLRERLSERDFESVWVALQDFRAAIARVAPDVAEHL